jgi:hypothetical protein
MTLSKPKDQQIAIPLLKTSDNIPFLTEWRQEEMAGRLPMGQNAGK